MKVSRAQLFQTTKTFQCDSSSHIVNECLSNFRCRRWIVEFKTSDVERKRFDSLLDICEIDWMNRSLCLDSQCVLLVLRATRISFI